METITYTGELTVVTCVPRCGIRFAIPSELYREALDDRGPGGTWITCPLGHRWHYTGPTEAERPREQLQRARNREAHLTSDLDQARARRTAPLTRLVRWMLADWRDRAGNLRPVADVQALTARAVAAYHRQVERGLAA